MTAAAPGRAGRHEGRSPAQVGFAAGLEAHGDAPAIVDAAGRVTSHAELAARAEAVADQLGPGRRLVAVRVGGDVGSIVAYLGVLRGGHVALVVPADDPVVSARILEGHAPDCILTGRGDEVIAEERRRGSVHDLHPDLALLLSTSGSTGSPRLVRLSHENLDSNAASIADYLDLRPSDRAALTLPLHYCYGLSVLHSHLAVGASVVVGAGSVVDPCFWERVDRERVTNFAGVPHTFDLLDRVGFADLEVPSLRFVTQAGGRMAPEAVRRHAEQCRARGRELVVMYGQTEATARMAYLPPELASTVPSAVGRAIPGGSLRVDRPDANGVGELVYSGPNVMLGYASTPADLARGREVDELRTGDLGRLDERGLVHVVGRTGRFAKLFGLRLDLDEIERSVGPDGSAVCVSDDEVLAIGVVAPNDAVVVAEKVRDEMGLPRSAVVALPYDELPRLASGKPDRQRVLADARAHRRTGSGGAKGAVAVAGAAAVDAGSSVSTVRSVYREVLGCGPVAASDTFVGLGGDSLSYVEVAMVLEEHLGELPETWHLLTVGELEAMEPSTRRVPAVETNVGLRAAAIALVVGSHAGVFTVLGGAHLLLGVAGYNFARFQVGALGSDRSRRRLASIARIAVPVVLWISMMFTWREPFSVPRLLLVDNVAGEGLWRYWFVEILVQLLALMAVVLAVRPVRELERRQPFGFALALLVAALLVRHGVSPFGQPVEPMYRTDSAAWLFFAGWAAQRAGTAWQRALVAAAVAVSVPGFFDGSTRALVVAAGLLALVWVPRVRVPAPFHRVLAVVAGASLWIFLTHFAAFPLLRPHLEPALLFLVAFPIGVGAAALVEATVAGGGRLLRNGVSAARRLSGASGGGDGTTEPSRPDQRVLAPGG